MNNLFKRLIELSKKTGDRIIFADVDGGNAHVVLSLDDYEKLVLGKVSAMPAKDQAPAQPAEKFSSSVLAEKPFPASPLEEMNREIVRTLEAERNPLTVASLDSFGKDADMEIEDRYYLEPIE